MNADRLDPRRFVSFDVETHRIDVDAGVIAPPLVCGSVAAMENGRAVGRLLDRAEARRVFRALLARRDVTIVVANGSFDFLVMAVDAARHVGDAEEVVRLIFEALRDGRVFDILTAEALHAIAEGTLRKDPRTGPVFGPLRDKRGRPTTRYSVHNVCQIVLDRDTAKANDEWVERYAELENVPIAEWPPTARTYPVDDSINELECGVAQVGGTRQLPGAVAAGTDVLDPVEYGRRLLEPSGIYGGRWGANRNLHDLAAQVYKNFALHLGAAWGLRTDPVAVEALASAVAAAREAGLPDHVAAGFVRPDGSEDQAAVKKALAAAYGAAGACPRCAGTARVPGESRCKVCGGTAVGTGSTAAGTCPPPCVNGRVPNPKTTKNCPTCSGTGFDIQAATSVPRTDTGGVSIGRDALIESGDERLMQYGAWQENDKLESTYLPFLRRGVNGPIVLRPNNPLETGRVSYADPSQTFPRQLAPLLKATLKERGAPVSSLRECIVARDGTVFYSNDYTGGELVTFSESALLRVGKSDLGQALISGADAHSLLGARMMGRRYEDFVATMKDKGHPDGRRCKDFRQCAKWGNFGFMGGMGAVKFVLTQRRQGSDTPHPSGPSTVWDGESKSFVPGYKGLRLCLLLGLAPRCGDVKVTRWGKEGRERDCPPTCVACIRASEEIRHNWFGQWSEARPYLAWHADNVEEVGTVVQHYSLRERGGTDFCSEANGDFQALLADIAGRAQCRVSHEQYVRQRVEDERSQFHGQESPLYGSRSIIFQHDELFGEAREDVAPEVSERVNEVMVEEFRKGCPNHAAACKAEETIMPRWWKEGEPRWHRGRLAPWTPDHDPKKCLDCLAPGSP